MRKACLLLTLLLAGSMVAGADSFRERLNAANAKLRSGDLEAALSAYRDLQVDYPESPELYYNMGCAKYMEAVKDAGHGPGADEAKPFEDARAAFEKAAAGGTGSIRRDAAFNGANCLAQVAKNMPSDAKQEDVLKAYQDSISAYEDVLRRYPGDPGANKNLDHMRYLLKKMLQNPQKSKNDQGAGDNQKKPDQEQKQEEKPQQNPQQNEGDKQKQEKDEQQSKEEQTKKDEEEQKQADQGQENEKKESQQKKEEQAPQMASGQEKDQAKQETGSNEKAETPDRKTVEALLQSLDDRDQIEQRSERRQPRQTKLKGDWW